jgi:hypothetical protein
LAPPKRAFRLSKPPASGANIQKRGVEIRVAGERIKKSEVFLKIFFQNFQVPEIRAKFS